MADTAILPYPLSLTVITLSSLEWCIDMSSRSTTSSSAAPAEHVILEDTKNKKRYKKGKFLGKVWYDLKYSIECPPFPAGSGAKSSSSTCSEVLSSSCSHGPRYQIPYVPASYDLDDRQRCTI